MMRLLIGVAAGYVLGTKAGRARYEQISRAAKAVATSPATKKVLDASRQKLADSLSTQPKLEPMKPLNEETTILVPHDQLKKNRSVRRFGRRQLAHAAVGDTAPAPRGRRTVSCTPRGPQQVKRAEAWI